MRRTEAITRCIQELLISAKDEKVTVNLLCNNDDKDDGDVWKKKRSKLQFDSFIPCSERIVRAVTDMVLLFPEVSSIFFKPSPTSQLLTCQSQEPGHSAVSASLSSLTAAATHFETECRMLILRFQLVLDLIMIMFMLLTIVTFKFLMYGLYLSYLS